MASRPARLGKNRLLAPLILLLAVGATCAAAAAIWFAFDISGGEVVVVERSDGSDRPAVEEPLDSPPTPAEVLTAERGIEGLRVRVFDVDGAPAPDRAVAAFCFDQFALRIAEARTGAEGTCTFESLDTRARAAAPGASTLLIAVDEPFLPSARAGFSLRQTLPEEASLRIPPTAPLTIRAVDREPLHERAVAFLSWNDGPRASLGGACGGIEVDLRDGIGTLAAVEPGVDLEIFVSGMPQGGGSIDWRTSLDATIVDVPVLWPAVMVSGRAIDSERCVLAKRTLRGIGRLVIETDAIGRFRAPLRTSSDSDESASRIAFSLRASAPPWNDVAWARMPWPDDFDGGIHELGDVTFSDGELAVSGRVVDETGKGLPRVRITVVFAASNERSREGRLDGPMTRPHELVTDEHGCFELRSPDRHEAVRLSVIHLSRILAAHSADANTVPFGTRDVELSLVPRPTLTGTLLLPPGVPSRAVRVFAHDRAPSEYQIRRTDQKCTVDDDGSFQIASLGSTSIRVEISAVSDREILREIELDGLEPLATQAPPSLQGIDLRREFQRIVVAVSDGDESPVAGARLFRRERLDSSPVEESSGRGRASEFLATVREIGATDEQGHAELWTTAPSIDLTVIARGMRAGRIDDVRGETKIVLKRSLDVRVVLDVVELGLDPTRVRGYFESLETGLPHLAGIDSPTQPYATSNGQGGMVCRLPMSGTWLLRLFYSPPDGRSLDLGRCTVEVDEHDSPQIFRRTLDPELARSAAGEARPPPR